MQLKYKLKNNTQLTNTKLVNIKKYRHNIQFSWNCGEMGSFASSQLSIDDFFYIRNKKSAQGYLYQESYHWEFIPRK